MENCIYRESKLKEVLEILSIDIDTSYAILILINSEILEVVGMFINLKSGNNFSSVYTHAE
ncbi:hypothetical protein GCM10008908_00090 [Clostridium subterminale]|uniref:Uncharacterized protein n=1 Tax=Clostridium subterminale TaxID=1550 RepID=A0ABP3VNK9_CLOSU